MIILVNGKPAVLKTGSSFDYISENRLFLGRDGYTLNIVFPLKDCPVNIEIFGYLNRIDVAKTECHFECSIIAGEISLIGTLSVTKVSEIEIECQFSQGRCEQTATDPFEEVFINDLDLGQPSTINASDVSVKNAWLIGRWTPYSEAVALPWVNESYPVPPNNDAVYNSDSNSYSWASDTKELSWQPYLLFIAKKICEAVGYDYDFTEWESSDFKYLIVCNTLPAAWDIPQYARALPHWTVSEFFEKLELLMTGEFDFDHRTKSVTFAFTKTALSNIPDIKIDDVVDSYSTEISQDDDADCEYLGVKRLAFKECSHHLWNYYSCDWFVSTHTPRRYDSIAQLLERNKRKLCTDRNGHPFVVYGDDNAVPEGQRPGENGQRPGAGSASSLLYAADVDTYFVFRSIGTECIGQYSQVGGWSPKVYCQKYVIQPVNQFGSGRPESDSEDTVEIEFVPPCIMETDDDHGDMMFLSISNYDETSDGDGRSLDERIDSVGKEPPVTQPKAAAAIEAGEKPEQSEYFDTIYVGFWNGTLPATGKMPYPVIDRVIITQDWQYKSMPFANMRLTDTNNNIASQIPMVNPAQKFKFSFLSSSIPNPRAVFNIRGKRYICEKITATFTGNGMSQLLKGEFFPLAEG